MVCNPCLSPADPGAKFKPTSQHLRTHRALVKAVFDANVLVKLFLAEPLSEVAEMLSNRAEILLAPDIVKIEVASAITRAHRNGVLSVEEASGKLEQWHRFTRFINLRLIACDELLSEAESLSLKLRHPLIDCLYLALARRETVPLITADEPLIDAATPDYPEV